MIVAAIVVNLATHPLVWLLLSRAGAAYWSWFVAVEVAAWLVEAALLAVWLRRDLALLGLTALVANLASVLAGMLLWLA